jgi:hypothetical protein
MSIARKLAVLFLLSLCFGSLAFAQGGATGAIGGVVQDASGAVIANAKVSVTSEATGEVLRQATTDASGLFVATLLPVGAYTVEVNAAGFPDTKFPGVVVRITETTRMTAVVKTSVVKEIVEVQSQVEQVNTTDATTGESLGAQTITDLPLATRNFQQLLTLSAGASSDLNGAAQLGRGQVYMHVNGGREDNNNYLIDGITVADYAFGELTYTPLPSPDAIEEFKVSTSLYDSTQGRNGGGNINATIKSGTSKFHGDAWEYFRNTALDANDYFLGEVVVKQNIFGGDFGGPIGPQAKLGYFYVNYQGTRQRSGDSPGTFINTSIPIVPGNRSLANLESVFSSAAAPNCPAIPLTSIDPVAFALLNAPGNQFGGGGFLFPTVPGTAGVTQTFNAATGTCSSAVNSGPLILTQPGKFTDNQFTESWDREFRKGKDRLSERFFYSNSDTYQPFGADSFGIQTGGQPGSNNLNFPLEIPLHGRFGSITETHVFSNTLINEFRFGVNIISDKLNNEAPITGKDIGINLPTANEDPNMYRLQFGTWAFGPYPTQLQSALSDNYTWLDTVSWTRGKHQLRFGGEIDRVAMRRSLPIADNGLIFFVAGATGYATDFQSFLAGSPLLGEGGGGLGNHDYRIPGFAWFAQDDYRVSKTLTLNLGFRNEFLGAPYDTLCHTGNTDPNLANTTGQPYIYPKCISQFGLTGISGTLNSAGLNNEYATVWEPRIGFAYDVAGRHTTSIRGGYGIYSVREDLGAVDNLAIVPPTYPFLVGFFPGPNSLANLFASSAAFPNGIPPLGAQPTQTYVPTPSILQNFNPTCTLGNGAPGTGQQCAGNFNGNVNSLIQLTVPLHWVAGTTQQWNLTIQQELGRDWFMELGYVGTKGTRLRSTFDPDQATLATPQHPVTITGAGCANLQAHGQSCQIVDSTVENASARAPYLGIAPPDFEDFAPNSDSHYNALQATLAHHFGKGLYFQSAYTWSKSIDDVSTASVAFLTRVNNQTDAAASRGLSDFDRRQRFVTSAVYQLPFFASASGLTKSALGGWEASGVIILQSGAPFAIYDPSGGSAYALASTPSSTATFSPGFSCANAPSSGSIRSRLANWVDPLAYQPDAPLTLSTGGNSDATGYGNTPRNCIIGPPQKNVDLTLGKTFKFGERQNLRFRTDFFNLFNHPSFQIPALASVSAAGGAAPITSTVGTPRLIQFSLKYSF